MLLTPELFAAALVAAVCQSIAHKLMKRRTYFTPIPRYVVGVTMALVPFSAAWAANPTQNPVVGIWFIFGACGFTTWLVYELDRTLPTEADVDRLVGYIAAEHDEDES